MPIEVDDGGGSGSPIVKKTAIGERTIGVLCAAPEMRQQTTTAGEKKWKDEAKTKPRNELVLTLLAMPGMTAPAGIGGVVGVPAPGDVVRMILRGGAFGDWIDAKKELGFAPRIGDVVESTIEYGQAWSEAAAEVGGKLTTQAECDAVPRNTSLGYYGKLLVRAATPAEAEWDAKACAFYNDANRPDASVVAPVAPF